MVNYHTSTLLESSEHVFELIRYNVFGCSARGVCRTWGRPLELRCRGGEALRLRCGWLAGGLPDRTLTFLALRRIDSQSEAGNGIATSQNRLLTRMHELISLIFCHTSPR